MGNCAQSGSVSIISSHGAAGGEGRLLVQRPRRRRTPSGGGEAAPPVVKVKLVLTKGELGRLLARLKAGDGVGSLEEVLWEMARKDRKGRPRADGDGCWRPSLESIAECPSETGLADSSDDDD